MRMKIKTKGINSVKNIIFYLVILLSYAGCSDSGTLRGQNNSYSYTPCKNFLIGNSLTIPIPLKLDKDIPYQYIETFYRAEEAWEESTGVDLFNIGETIDIQVENSYIYDNNTIYWIEEYDGSYWTYALFNNNFEKYVHVGIAFTDLNIIMLNAKALAPYISSSNYFLETVVIHELGHILGLGHHPNPSSIMYYRGDQRREYVITSDNIQDVHCLYNNETRV